VTWFRNVTDRAVLIAAMILVVILGNSEIASAGGAGCHSQAITNERGAAVTVAGFCFEPTVLRVQPGETVTWTNEDSVPHTVTGANNVWGSFDQFGRGETLTERFDESGVYPYWCALHPSMLGTVVVGDGSEASSIAMDHDSSELSWGALGAAAGVMLTSAGMIAWRRRPSLVSRFG